ncbi:3098_t:CDS:2 [Diversispora eburnea]|uniref:3098_t:CDS:1 n=1 Tax=Diversispora eburnea TaxID=1213867 RepID=A0A9N9CES5_9GLOM|nr:3098_t:CDS:2 [Diversispora eburnea]
MPPFPVHSEFSEKGLDIITQVGIWKRANENYLVGGCTSSQGTYTLTNLENPNNLNKPTVLGPDAAVVLKTRWDTLSVEDKGENFPNFSKFYC